MADVPLVNGTAHDYASIEVQVEGATFLKISSIEYEHNCEPGKVRGTAAQPVGRTTGDYDASGSLECHKDTAHELRKVLVDNYGTGYMVHPFDIVVTYSPSGADMITDKLIACRIKSESDSHSSGSDGLSVKIDLDILKIVQNGYDPLPNMW